MRCFLLGFLLITFYAKAQEKIPATHSIFIEALGAGGYYSLNYDKILFVGNKAVYSIRVGVSGLYNEVDTNKKGLGMTFPLTFNRWNTVNKKHHFETSIGAAIYWGYLGNGFEVVRKVRWGVNGFNRIQISKTRRWLNDKGRIKSTHGIHGKFVFHHSAKSVKALAHIAGMAVHKIPLGFTNVEHGSAGLTTGQRKTSFRYSALTGL